MFRLNGFLGEYCKRAVIFVILPLQISQYLHHSQQQLIYRYHIFEKCQIIFVHKQTYRVHAKVVIIHIGRWDPWSMPGLVARPPPGGIKSFMTAADHPFLSSRIQSYRFQFSTPIECLLLLNTQHSSIPFKPSDINRLQRKKRGVAFFSRHWRFSLLVYRLNTQH